MDTTLVKTFENADFGKVRIVMIDSEPWFVAKDVCDALELTNITVTLDRLDEDELTSVKLNSGGQVREMKIVNEYGLYNLILGSRKPEAKKFKRWVTHEVLPSIRKTGKYQAPQFTKKADNTFRIGEVDGYFDENGKMFFSLEDTARALGQIINIPGRSNTYVRWDKVKEKLCRLNYIKPYQKLDREAFIPEDVFYSMVDQARNATAKEFQAIVKAEMPQKEVVNNKKYKISVQHLVKDIRCGAEEIEKTFGVSYLTAIDRAIELKEQITGIDLDVLHELLPIDKVEDVCY